MTSGRRCGICARTAQFGFVKTGMGDERYYLFDTSALAKWYINEARSDDVENTFRSTGRLQLVISRWLKMRCLLARRRRERNIDTKMEMEIFATFQEDVRQRFIICHPCS